MHVSVMLPVPSVLGCPVKVLGCLEMPFSLMLFESYQNTWPPDKPLGQSESVSYGQLRTSRHKESSSPRSDCLKMEHINYLLGQEVYRRKENSRL